MEINTNLPTVTFLEINSVKEAFSVFTRILRTKDTVIKVDDYPTALYKCCFSTGPVLWDIPTGTYSSFNEARNIDGFAEDKHQVLCNLILKAFAPKTELSDNEMEEMLFYCIDVIRNTIDGLVANNKVPSNDSLKGFSVASIEFVYGTPWLGIITFR